MPVIVICNCDSCRLARIEAMLEVLILQGVQMSQELDQLEAQVTNTTTVEESAIQLLNGLAAQIAALKTDPAKLQALSDSLKSKSSDLAAAVAANTPAA